jgi:hypothetical protein
MQRTALLLAHGVALAAALNLTKFVAVGDVGSTAFQLLAVDFANETAPYTPLGPGLPGWLLVQGDATTVDATNQTFYAVLNRATGGNPDYSNSSLFAFDARTGAVLSRYDFQANYTMGALAFLPERQLVVGLCGALLTNGSVQGYCGFDPARGALSLIFDFEWTISYDPDTRALDPKKQLYFHRLYNSTWMPDYFVTLDANTGELKQFTQFFSPEFSGTRIDVASGALFSICNADAGLDLCLVNPATGEFKPLNVFDRAHQRSELFAATAALDPVNSLFLLTVSFADDGMLTRVVDIDSKSPTYASIVANYSVPHQWFPSNYHPLGVLDAKEVQ